MNFTIHRADKRHLPEINRLVTETKISDPMESLDGVFWFARAEGRIVACGGVQLIGSETGIVVQLAVEKPFRKKGICISILKKIDEYVKERGVKTLALATMYYLYNFFKKRGYRTIPRAGLPDHLKNYSMFVEKRYMKCGVMIRELS